MVYANPNGYDWSNNYNYDGLGISYIVFAVVYSLVFYAMCGIVWYYRKHPIIRMRNIGLALSSIFILHVYLFLVLLAYPLNGNYPCDVEFWIMSIYLPIGIGLFQAQNQQLLLVSREQSKLIVTDELFKPLPPKGRGAQTWVFCIKQWWNSFSKQGKYEGFVAFGIVFQVGRLSGIAPGRTADVNASSCFRQSSFAFRVNSPAPESCRWPRPNTSADRAGSGKPIWLLLLFVALIKSRIPSIGWQFLWNYFFGPILLWKIRMIRDIYHWRLQTILCVVAG